MTGETITIPSLSDLTIGPAPPGIMDKLMEPIESGFTAIGLTTPLLRFLGAAGFTGVVLMVFKPNSFYFGGGEALSWSAWTAASADSEVPSTWMPWWLFAVLCGLFFATFI